MLNCQRLNRRFFFTHIKSERVSEESGVLYRIIRVSMLKETLSASKRGLPELAAFQKKTGETE